MVESKQGSLNLSASKAFTGVRFVLFGFDFDEEQKLRSKIVIGGGVDSDLSREDCTHVIVDKVVCDDPVCVWARNDGKKIVTSLWVLHSHDAGMPADTSLIIYSPVKDLSGIPAAKPLVVCLTGYQRQDRDDIMTMVGLMGAQFSKPLVANKVTHLICYKFEGEKYELAKKIKRIKLVNHKWLEDCLRSWDVVPESKYSKSGYELELVEEVKDSDDEAQEQTGLQSTSREPNHYNLRAEVLTSHAAATSKGSPNPTLPPSAAMGNNRTSVRTPLSKHLRDPQYVAMDPLLYHSSTTELCGHVETRNDLASTTEKTSGFPVSSASKINPAGFSRITTMNLAQGSIEPTTDRVAHPSDMWDMFDDRGDDANFGFVTTPKKVEVGIADTNSKYLQTSEYIKSNRSDGSLLSPMEIPSEISKPGSKKPVHIEENSSHLNSVHNSPVSMLLMKASKLSKNLGSRSNELSKFETYHRENGSPRADFFKKGDTDLSMNPIPTEVPAPHTAPNLVSETANLRKEQEDIGTSVPIVQEMEQSKSGAKNDADNTKNDNFSTVFSRKNGNKSLGSKRKLGMRNTVGKKGLVLQNGRCPVEKGNSGCSVVEKEDIEEIKGMDRREGSDGKGRESIPDKMCKRVDSFPGKKHAPEKEENPVYVVQHAVEVEGDRYHVGDRFESNGSTEPVIVEKQPQFETMVSTGKKSVVAEEERKTGKLRGNGSVKRKNFSVKTKKGAVKNSIKADSNKYDLKMDTQNSQNSEKKETECLLQPPVSIETMHVQKYACASARAEKENIPIVDDAVNIRKNVTKDKLGHTNALNSNKNVQTCKGCDTGVIISGRMETVSSRKELGSFILSGHRLQRKEFQKIIKSLKGRICRDSHQWSYQASHFIVPEPVRRTEKFFAAVASGRWVLKSEYLAASSREGRFLEEEAFEWHKNGLSEDGTINLEAPRKWRLLRERTGHGVFYSMRVLVYGECIAPPLDTLKRVVKAGDGAILATCPPYARFLASGNIDYVIMSPGIPRADAWVAEFMRHEIPCVVADYLVEYACKPGYSLDRHVLYKTHAWAEKSFGRLQKRSEEDDMWCRVCGSRDREDVMLICGDEKGSFGCGAGTHIDCCDPPLGGVPEGDWFCGDCCGVMEKCEGGKRKRNG